MAKPRVRTWPETRFYSKKVPKCFFFINLKLKYRLVNENDKSKWITKVLDYKGPGFEPDYLQFFKLRKWIQMIFENMRVHESDTKKDFSRRFWKFREISRDFMKVWSFLKILSVENLEPLIMAFENCETWPWSSNLPLRILPTCFRLGG